MAKTKPREKFNKTIDYLLSTGELTAKDLENVDLEAVYKGYLIREKESLFK
ncbi:hypothetical protein [Orenia marismortui]|uniref:Uncharacterized protein n=1 Tax=Orenia marismortui TaxID=46469 RepID=A0A4R8GGE8_9FIRM|nr:hypothetical protein [Orenia marismortui]TDX44592.1 hypothetical protein C7959_15016 [Orenia marismortui]